MKKILAISLIAMTAVSAANAQIASKQYVDDRASAAVTTANTYTDTKIGDISAADVATEIANAITTAGSNQVQANWTETNESSKAYINNKPTLGALAAKDTVAKTDLATALASEIEGKANTADLGTAASANVADSIAENEEGLATAGQVYTAVANAQTASVANLDLAQVGGNGNVILTVSQSDGRVAATAGKITNANVDDNAAIAQSKISNLTSDLASKADTSFVGTLPAGATATTVTGYIDEAAAAAASDLDYTGATGGNVIIQVTQTDGTVSATMGNAIMETDATGVDGISVLTRKVDNGVTTYQWETIQRGTNGQ